MRSKTLQTNPSPERTNPASDPVDAAINARLRRHVMDHAVPAEKGATTATLSLTERLGIGFLMLLSKLMTAFDRKNRIL